MIRGIYTAVSGLITQEAKQDVVTNNLANANTIGYKTENLATKKFEDVLLSNYDKKVLGKNVKNNIGSISLGSKIDETLTYFSQGNIIDSDRETDFAINGRGFFTLQGENGRNYYTRDGKFNVDIQGYLVGSNGNRVLGENLSTGQREPIYVGNGKLSVDKEGNIAINNNVSHRFLMSDFENYNSLHKVGDNLYQGENPNFQGAFHIKQNALEASNVNVVNEMVNMMTVMRHFETNQKMIQMMDETLGKAANEVGALR
ncbi:flagellar hook-basal body complex protein [Clostridium hydrogeniformans]|uniref:flagellar hook-basal body complex protein n=1 Tax=Clostridium hydrogeniformans TaxID=349933 RepID=UPI000489923B|nr:flagellar hook-basal body complex protein [Clostridium hydrogeniformans]